MRLFLLLINVLLSITSQVNVQIPCKGKKIVLIDWRRRRLNPNLKFPDLRTYLSAKYQYKKKKFWLYI